MYNYTSPTVSNQTEPMECINTALMTPPCTGRQTLLLHWQPRQLGRALALSSYNDMCWQGPPWPHLLNPTNYTFLENYVMFSAILKSLNLKSGLYRVCYIFLNPLKFNNFLWNTYNFFFVFFLHLLSIYLATIGLVSPAAWHLAATLWYMYIRFKNALLHKYRHNYQTNN